MYPNVQPEIATLFVKIIDCAQSLEYAICANKVGVLYPKLILVSAQIILSSMPTYVICNG